MHLFGKLISFNLINGPKSARCKQKPRALLRTLNDVRTPTQLIRIKTGDVIRYCDEETLRLVFEGFGSEPPIVFSLYSLLQTF